MVQIWFCPVALEFSTVRSAFYASAKEFALAQHHLARVTPSQYPQRFRDAQPFVHYLV